MNREISDGVRNAFSQLVKNDKVLKALKFMEEDHEEIVKRQIELTLIPAPTGQEGNKAKRLLEMFREEGLEDCHIDEYGNAIGILRGTGGGKRTLCEAHMDTVFPMDTELNLRRENGWICCPGIVDDTRGCVSMLSAIRAIKHSNLQIKGDIHFVGTTREEGVGAFGGMRDYVSTHPELEASISIDGAGYKKFIAGATGILTYEITFHGVGGHASGAFGKVANPLAAAGRAMAKINELRVPETPRVTFAVTGCHAGSYEAIHAIQETAVMTVNLRSDSQEELMKYKELIFDCIDKACREETDRWGMDEITYESKSLCDIKAYSPDLNAPIIQGALLALNYLGCEEPEVYEGGATNCSVALEAGLPAICLGDGSDYDTKCHSLQEQFKEENAFKLCQATLLCILLCAGSEITKSILE